jgi:hypothetical protein
MRGTLLMLWGGRMVVGGEFWMVVEACWRSESIENVK